MTPKEFIKQVESFRPTKQELLNSGIDEDGIERILNGYVILPRHEPINIGINDNFYRDLIGEYDISNIEIGPICFPEIPSSLNPNQLIIAYDCTAPIVVDKSTDEVLLLDMNEPTHVMASCAKNIKAFFSALLLANDFLDTLSKDESLWDDPDSAKPIIAQCTLMAGGKKYRQFYEMLVGLEE